MRGSGVRMLMLATCLGSSMALFAEAQDGDAERAADRALREAEALKSEESLGQMAERLERIVERATKALEAGHEELALALAVGPLDIGEALVYQASNKEGITDHEAFHALWKKNSGTLDAALEGIDHGVCPDSAALVRAIAERGLNQAALYYRAADATARASGTEGGLFYIGRARGKLHLQRFCENSWSDAKPPRLRVSEAMIKDLEQQTVVEFEKSSGGVEQHGRFITINALIKELRELQPAGLHFGAADAFLDARRTLAEIRDTPALHEELMPLLAKATEQLSASTRDDSIVMPLIQQARLLLEAEEPEENSLLSASAILRDAVPTYFNLVSPE
jgi:hypothetical protein